MGYGLVDAYEALLATPSLALSIHEYAINDSEGNNNGNANPGETVKITLSLINNGESPVNDVNVTITSTNEYITIINNSASFGNFASGEIKTVEDAFTVELSPLTPAKNKMIFKAQINTSSDLFNGTFNFTCFDYHLNLLNTSIDDAGGNGILDPNETANLLPVIGNSGNEPVIGLTGFLTSSSTLITINSNSAVYGDMNPDENKTEPYNVTLSNNAVPGSVYIPFNLLLTDEDGRNTSVSFAYKDKCTIVFDLYDSYGDGWNNAKLVVNFSDGTPTQNLTVPLNGSHATFNFEKNSGVTVSLSWISGGWDSECSFEVYYQDGGLIYSASGHPGSGVFFSWVVNCGGSAINCEAVSNFTVEQIGTTAKLTWEPPTSGTPDYYDIYHDYIFVGTTTETTFTVSKNAGIFCVYAIYNNCLMPACEQVEVDCAPVEALTASIDSPASEITLTWEVPLEGEPENYSVYLNDELVETTTETTYTQPFFRLGTYNFCVTANYSDGCVSPAACEEVTITCDMINIVLAATIDADGIHLSWTPALEYAIIISIVIQII
jgi:hypothetical protein